MVKLMARFRWRPLSRADPKRGGGYVGLNPTPFSRITHLTGEVNFVREGEREREGVHAFLLLKDAVIAKRTFTSWFGFATNLTRNYIAYTGN